MTHLITSVIAFFLYLTAPATAVDAESVPTVSATIIKLAPNVRTYELRSSLLFVPVSNQSAFDEAATGFAQHPHSIRTIVQVDLTNTGEEAIFVGRAIAGGIEGGALRDPATGDNGACGHCSPGNQPTRSPASFLRPGRPLGIHSCSRRGSNRLMAPK